MVSNFQIIAILACLAAVNARFISHGHTYAATPVHYHDTHPHYKFSYGVDDHHTGDSKYQHEERDGDVVHGEYSLIDYDGYQRIVKYSADDHNGFNAVVHRVPITGHIKTVSPPIHQHHIVHPKYSYYHH